MKRCFSSLLLVVALSTKAGLTNAVYWDFDHNGASPASNSFSADLSVVPLTRTNPSGSAQTFDTSAPSTGYITAAGFSPSAGTNAVARFGTTGQPLPYFSVALSLSASVEYSLQLTNVSFGSYSTASGPSSLSLFTSTNAFSTDSELAGSITGISTNSQWAAEQFGGLALDIPPGETLSLRLYGSVGYGSSSAQNWRIDDLGIALTAVPAPEPSNVVLFLAGGAAWRLFRKSRNSVF